MHPALHAGKSVNSSERCFPSPEWLGEKAYKHFRCLVVCVNVSIKANTIQKCRRWKALGHNSYSKHDRAPMRKSLVIQEKYYQNE